MLFNNTALLAQLTTNLNTHAHYKRQWTERVENDRFDDLDPLLVPLLKELNEIDGLSTMFSCSSHPIEEAGNDKKKTKFYLLMTYNAQGLHAIYSIHEALRHKHRPCFATLSFTHVAGPNKETPTTRCIKLEMHFRDPRYHLQERERLIANLRTEIEHYKNSFA